MIFLGSKARIAKDLLTVMNPDPEKLFIEPFAGGMNLTVAWEGKRWANDAHFALMEMWLHLVKIQNVPFINEERYEFIRYNPDLVPAWEYGLAGYVYSYRGKWFGGYSKTTMSKTGVLRNYAQESRRNVMRQLPSLKDVHMTCMQYFDMKLPDPDACVLYCDPPYSDKTGYGFSKNFDSESFWGWVRSKAKQNYTVYVSEYTAPSDFKSVWEKTVNNSLHNNGGKEVYKPVERLFVYAGN